MSMKKIFASLGAMAIAAVTVMPSQAVSAAGYGAAGCGLGSIVFGSKPGLFQILAATTNGTFGSQTLGITFGTSNCGGGLVSKARQEQQMFAQANYDSLKQEMARGEGEKLENLAALMGCRAESTDAFASLAQKNYSVIFAGDVASDVLVDRVSSVASSDASLASSCSYL